MSKKYTINGNELNCFITYSDIKTRLFQNYNNHYGYHGYFDIFTDKKLTSYECEKIGDLINRCFNDYDKDIENSEKEKQRLISFLEDKIKETGEKINTFYETHIDKNCLNLEIKLETFQEVLDFFNKGGK